MRPTQTLRKLKMKILRKQGVGGEVTEGIAKKTELEMKKT